MDQYKNPHESKHTVGEILRWLDRTGFEFVYAIPRTVPFASFDASEKLFHPDKLGNRMERFLVYLEMIFSGHKEGGFFIVIAQKSKSMTADRLREPIYQNTES